ncbi:hypothetical protein GGI25_000502 [Coemansia spiralis]|uniref:BAR-domain-containing protein n=2 Tax=Coemansia TaxID=4863 RepID=A0A9W8GBY2_9FUNG|nr:hypothetical protein EDC05_000329 [Coemansia umbellata]KAJ2625406.1 hypothetical protein GGI26_000546 [Coemansia sp. RSA 1358]KAJ2680529.1 hypothetical protein GGI25_000502 [Coemansia spiralis]
MSAIKRGIGKLGQRTGELLGIDSGTKIEVSEEFKDLLFETDHRHSGTEAFHAALLLYTNQLLKKKDASDNSKLKLYLLENLGSSMVRLGSGLPKDSGYGHALRELGKAEERMSEHQVEFVNKSKEGMLPTLQRSLDDFKEYVSLQKKLESRRSEYDSKLVKFQKARKDNMTVEDELRTAQVRYEDAYDDLAYRMLDMQDKEQDCLREAYSLYQAQLAYHQSCFEELGRLRGMFEDCLKAKRAPAAERHPLGRALDSRRAALTMRGSEMSGSARQPIPFGTASSVSLSRSVSHSVASRHYRNGSSQFSDISDEIGGGYDSGMAAKQEQARQPQPPQFARVQSDSVATTPGRQGGMPTAAPRRHAPAPPTPSRSPRRTLRRSIYKFHANEIGELPMEKGDIVEVVERIDDGWWKGKLVYSVSAGVNGPQVGKTGLFPANYTEDCNETDIPSTPISGGHQRSASLAPPSVKDCACGCSEFEPSNFQPNKCKTCFHHHY